MKKLLFGLTVLGAFCCSLAAAHRFDFVAFVGAAGAACVAGKAFLTDPEG